jgi:hypothetical protein
MATDPEKVECTVSQALATRLNRYSAAPTPPVDASRYAVGSAACRGRHSHADSAVPAPAVEVEALQGRWRRVENGPTAEAHSSPAEAITRHHRGESVQRAWKPLPPDPQADARIAAFFSRMIGRGRGLRSLTVFHSSRHVWARRAADKPTLTSAIVNQILVAAHRTTTRAVLVVMKPSPASVRRAAPQ